MPTKEEVLARAKELSLTLTDAEIDKHVADGKLPERKDAGTKVEELAGKYSGLQLAQMVLELRGENAEHRHKNVELKRQNEALTGEIGGFKDIAAKSPELEAKLKQSEAVITGFKDSEKKRRETILGKIPEEKRNKILYLLDVDKIGGNEFESTVELLTETKTGGNEAPPPGPIPTLTLTPEQKQDAARMGLDEKAYLEIEAKRNKNRGPDALKLAPTQ